MSDNRPNNHVRVLCFAHSLCSFWELVVAFVGQKTHIQYATKSSWCTAENTSAWVCCQCLNGMRRSRVLYKRLTFAVSVSSWAFGLTVNISFFGCLLHRTVWMSVSERLLCFRWMDVDHVCSLWTTDGPAGICVHIKNTIISERNHSCIVIFFHFALMPQYMNHYVLVQYWKLWLFSFPFFLWIM